MAHRVKTFSAGGANWLPADSNQMEDEYEYAFSAYKTILRRSSQVQPNLSDLCVAGIAMGTNVYTRRDTLAPLASKVDCLFYLDPADRTTPVAGGPLGANPRTFKYRITSELITGQDPIGVSTATFGLYQVTAWSTGTSTPTVSAYTAATTHDIPNPGINGRYGGVSFAFTAPAGWYFLGLIYSGTPGVATHQAAVELQYQLS